MGIPEIVRVTEPDLVNGCVVGIAVFDIDLVPDLVNGWVVGTPEIVRVTEPDLVNGCVVGIPDFDLVTVGDIVLETVILYVLVDTRVVASADRLVVLVTEIV